MKIANETPLIKFSQTYGEKATRNKFLDQDIEFWANLEWMYGGKELWEASSRLFGRVYILSSAGTTDPNRAKSVIEGKKLWLKKNIPSLSDNRIFIVLGKHMKQQYASRDSILVDDMPVTIKQWDEKGGYGILHNSKHYEKTIEELEDLSKPLKLAELAKRFQ
jgi:hypothetical protein